MKGEIAAVLEIQALSQVVEKFNATTATPWRVGGPISRGDALLDESATVEPRLTTGNDEE